MNETKLGQLIETTESKRNAVHVAAEKLMPGEWVGLVEENNFELVGDSSVPVGIVDPFLRSPVRKGQRFYLCLPPNSVTSLRHSWDHPAFLSEAPPIKKQITIEGDSVYGCSDC